MLKIGLLGAGTVGGGIIKILYDLKGRDPLLEKIELVSVAVHDIQKSRSIFEKPKDSEKLKKLKEILTNNPESIVNNPDIDIVVELIGGIEPARTLIIKAIENQKHVVTANKALIAQHGTEIFALAARKGVSVRFEAAVAGGIPILETLKSSMGANRIESIVGIVNGTCNYILTQMTEFEMIYEQALAAATEHGYAEANPDADVSGRDSAEKLSILISEGFGLNVDPQVLANLKFVEGITSIHSRDIECAKEFGYTIKLLATSKIQPDGKLLFSVRPNLVSNNHPLAAVKDALNAIYIKGDRVGELVLSGKGAGEAATASAVVADILNTVKGISSGVAAISPPSIRGSSEFVTLSNEMESKFYLRILTSDIPMAFGGIMWFLGGVGIVPESVRQITSNGLLEIVMITQKVPSQKLKNVLKVIGMLPHCQEIANALPLLEVSKID